MTVDRLDLFDGCVLSARPADTRKPQTRNIQKMPPSTWTPEYIATIEAYRSPPAKSNEELIARQ